MSLVDILEPVLKGGIKNTNFFNGRLLAAEDLTAFQTANAQQHQQLGRAVGEGVAYGLEVSVKAGSNKDQAVLHVTQGLAFNRKGEAVALPMDVDVALVPQVEAQNAEAGLFAVCNPPQETVFTNPGLYVLTAMPASGLSKESAPKTEVFNEGVSTTCGSRFAVEGAKFNRVRLQLGASPDPNTLAGQVFKLAADLDPLFTQLGKASGAAAEQIRAQIAPKMSKLRNCAAHLCFGTEELAGFAADPFARVNGDSPFSQYGALDDLRKKKLITDCEVPLALFYWTSTGIQFVDMWAARRPLSQSIPSNAWPLASNRRRTAEGLGIFLQFQAHLADMTFAPLTSVSVQEFFRYLPAAGLIPIAGVKGSLGFDYRRFFNGVTYHDPVFIEGSKWDHVLFRSMLYPPKDLSNPEMVWLYTVRENIQQVDQQFANPPQPYMLFTNGHMPYEGNAQFDLSYWDYANYA